MTLPMLPIWTVDFVGSSLMIVISFLCVYMAVYLFLQDKENAVWIYFLWITSGLAFFALSRGIGHIAKDLLIVSGHTDIWKKLRPYSGAFNTITFILVASITLFFERIWKIYQTIIRDKQALQKSHEQILYLNKHLEDLVAERTLKLKSSEKKYRRIFESSRDMIVVTDKKGLILELNTAGSSLLGLAKENLLQKKHYLKSFFAHDSDWDKIVTQLLNQGYINDIETELVSPVKKNIRYVLLNGTVEYFEEKEKNSNLKEIFHFLVKDITRRKTMEQQLLQADKLASIGKLAAGVAHEINNPLNIILGYTQLLLKHEQKGTQKYEDLRIIEKHVCACRNIVNDLLKFSRRSKTQKQFINLNELIKEVIKVASQQFEFDRIKIETNYDPNVPSMVLDGDKIKQVFMNIFMNAKDAIGEDGKITISTNYLEKKHTVEIKIQDTGCGIEPHHISKIFDPFFTTKETGKGTGLGLSVSYGIIKEHDGDIKVFSKVGQGTTFLITLPIRE
ncbi:PAS domain S-box-containing protein [Desulfonauticus submarinus]|uniref:histidine kinase n=1 Tax=Desulfonauticus submarinus TaxID=206665 RepID=A0A1H0G1J9_9BACT|nr:ATP-binding protein [Desulfonauticus submarinus]SDO00742.1 PAS domain S-box-containing protein [Desulfonauticus submarinus]